MDVDKFEVNRLYLDVSCGLIVSWSFIKGVDVKDKRIVLKLLAKNGPLSVNFCLLLDFCAGISCDITNNYFIHLAFDRLLDSPLPNMGDESETGESS